MNVVDGWWRCHGQLCFISQKGICQICQIRSSLTVSDRLWGILRNKILKRTVTELCQMSSLSEYMFRISKKNSSTYQWPRVCTHMKKCTFSALFLCPVQLVISALGTASHRSQVTILPVLMILFSHRMLSGANHLISQ